MKITSRFATQGFLELKVDEIEVTIFPSSKTEIEETIENLQNVISDLEILRDKK